MTLADFIITLHMWNVEQVEEGDFVRFKYSGKLLETYVLGNLRRICGADLEKLSETISDEIQ